MRRMRCRALQAMIKATLPLEKGCGVPYHRDTFKLDSDCKFCNLVKEGVSAVRLSDWSSANDATLLEHMTSHSSATEGL